MAITIISDNKQGAGVYKDVLPILSGAGVPDDARWRSLILYFREMKDYNHLSDTQKAEIQSLLTNTLASRDYSDASLQQVLEAYKTIIAKPYKEKIEALLRDASAIIANFQELLSSRYGNIRSLEDNAIAIVEEESSGESLVNKLRGAFNEVKSLLENDMKDLESQAFRDGLTNVGNRRSFDSFMEQEIERWREGKTPLTLAMFDIDHFKGFNDTHGHRIGDQVLRLVGQTLDRRASSLAEDGNSVLAARYGGEEFALVVAGPEASRLPEIADELRHSIMNFNFVIRDTEGKVVENGLNITVSAGIAACRKEWKSNHVENLVEYADKALYAAKAGGRNQVMVHNPGSKNGFSLVKKSVKRV